MVFACAMKQVQGPSLTGEGEDEGELMVYNEGELWAKGLYEQQWSAALVSVQEIYLACLQSWNLLFQQKFLIRMCHQTAPSYRQLLYPISGFGAQASIISIASLM
ncbi:OLC1v1031616C1 [Oldenlandia corymbosa var. corymbosa]|uniref:OLC1v1031616C1 n=1 Tax=Oldenlandia corymbosa var. corymbosa TaxID=529605 RepID=A0AAV1CM82_OLDCO|nr:OLC1v1031616C1 [Oldenlandia corymbosa var. corymbosa]